jgi:RND family efflux transporter MFP subunit
MSPRAVLLASAALLAALVLAACDSEPQSSPPAVVRPVRTITVEAPRAATPTSFIGRIESQEQAALAFRIGGRIAERLVGVGEEVREGQILARLDPENELNALRSARAALSAAQGLMRRMDNQYERQKHLLERGVTSQADFEVAEQARTAARSQVDAAEANLAIAKEVVGFTTLNADAAGVVTATGAEPGEVVVAGRMIVQLARRAGRDAVFELPESALRTTRPDDRIVVTLNGDPSVTASGRVREIAPEADPVTRTFQVRVGLNDPPSALRLGTAVTGRSLDESEAAVAIPASALLTRDKAAAVWVVDPATSTVSLRPLEILRADPATALVGAGLSPGDVVVTAGVNRLSEGQAVRLLGVGS